MSQAAAQHSAAGSESAKSPMPLDEGAQRAVVQPHLGVGEVVVVDQHQVRAALAGQLGHLGQLAGHVGLHLAPPDERAGPDPVRSYSPIAIRCVRSTGWLAGASCRTAKRVIVPSGPVW